MTSQDIAKTLIDSLSCHDAQRIAIFGSRLRGDHHIGSDLDILVSFSKRKSLLTMVAIERELSETLGVKVDLLTEESLSPHLRESILAQMKIIYQSRTKATNPTCNIYLKQSSRSKSTLQMRTRPAF